jgi:hypothetical protein
MLAAASLLVVVLLALLVMRVATAVLTTTGLSREAARFQVRSALTGVGFTTSETESVVNHPVRRRVVMMLMLVGSAGVITAVTTLIISFARTDREGALLRILVLVGGLAVLLLLARSSAFDRPLQRLISRALARDTDLDVRDYAALLHISGEYSVAELLVEEGDWVAGRRLDELEGLRVLGIERREGGYLGAPAGSTIVEAGDTLVLYGRAEDVAELDERKAGPTGDEEHRRAVAEGVKV